MSKKTSPSKPEQTAAPAPRLRTIELADLDVLPPVRRPAKPGAPMPLAEIEDHMRAFEAKIEDRTLGYHNEVIYDIVGDGLMLLKAQAVHVLIETVSTKRRKRTADGRRLAKTEGGFLAWLRARSLAGQVFESEAEGERYYQARQRTAYNYMKAATSVGLTSDHALDDVEELRQREALHGRRPTELYKGKLPLEIEDTPPENDAPPVNLAAQAFATATAALGELTAVKEHMGPDEYETAWRHLQSVLEDFTGAAWEMTDRKPSLDAIEHGTMTEAAPKKRTPEARAQLASAQRERWAKQAAKKGARK